MPSVDVTRAHSLPIAEAHARAQAMADKLAAEYGATWAWRGEQIQFSGSGVTGTVDVDPSDLKVHVDLPFYLAAMQDTVAARVNAALDEALATPSAGAPSSTPATPDPTASTPSIVGDATATAEAPIPVPVGAGGDPFDPFKLLAPVLAGVQAGVQHAAATIAPLWPADKKYREIRAHWNALLAWGAETSVPSIRPQLTEWRATELRHPEGVGPFDDGELRTAAQDLSVAESAAVAAGYHPPTIIVGDDGSPQFIGSWGSDGPAPALTPGGVVPPIPTPSVEQEHPAAAAVDRAVPKVTGPPGPPPPAAWAVLGGAALGAGAVVGALVWWRGKRGVR